MPDFIVDFFNLPGESRMVTMRRSEDGESVELEFIDFNKAEQHRNGRPEAA